MSKNTIYKITVTNWTKHNSDHKKSFKKTLLMNNFVTDAKVRTLSMTERWLFLNLIVTCSDHGGDTVELTSKQLRDMVECNRNLDGTLDHLQSLQLVTWSKRALLKGFKGGIERIEGHDHLEDLFGKPPDKPAIKVSKSKKPKPQEFDFKSLYNEYPRQSGLTSALSKLRAQIKTQQDFDDCLLAIKKYREVIVRLKTEPAYVLHFKTFVSSWRDFLEPNYGKTDIESEPTGTRFTSRGNSVDA